MSAREEKRGFGIVFFRPSTPKNVRPRRMFFFILCCLLVLGQACYWLFANSAKPIIMGMPLGMFCIVMMIAVQFFILLILYLIEVRDMKD